MGLQGNAVRQKKFRDTRKTNLKRLCETNSTVATSLKLRKKSGRPRLEEDQPELLKTIADLVSFRASAEGRRRSMALYSCSTLWNLNEALEESNFLISRSAAYIRVLPRNKNTLEGKRHVKSVPVRLKRADTSFHKGHIDQNFCVATIRAIETISSILGPNQVVFLSPDDKARVPLGITAAKKQAPILMHLEYEVYLRKNVNIFLQKKIFSKN